MTETWRPIVGCLYEVSDLGRVRSLVSGKVLKPFKKREYRRVAIGGKSMVVHRLVLEAFQGPCPPGHESGHIDGNPANNALTNLAWITKRENAYHRLLHGTMLFGRRNPAARLDEDVVREIRAQAGRVSQRGLAARFGVGPSTIRRVLTGKRWSWVS